MNPSSKEELSRNVRDIVFRHMEASPQTHVLVIYDTRSPLAEKMKDAYQEALAAHPKTTFLDFNSIPLEQVEARAKTLAKGDIVILIQSLSFRVSIYRWRLELFDHGLKVVEHVRLSQIKPREEETYVHALKYDVPYTKPTALALAELLKTTQKIKVECREGSIYEIAGKMEPPIINTGNLATEKVKGGYYPVGEIFSEPADLTHANGEVEIFAFPGEDHQMVFLETPFKIKIVNGMVQDGNFPPEFQPLIDMLCTENPDGKIPVREFGLGLNRAITRRANLTEATAWERVAGLHLSLGMKHGTYMKKFKKSNLEQRYHVDIYPDVKRIWISNQLVFEDGKFLLVPQPE